WISRGDEDDPKSQAIRAISDDGLKPFRVSGPGRVDILNTLALFKSSRIADLRKSASDLEDSRSGISTPKSRMDVDEESVNDDGNASEPAAKTVYDIAAEDGAKGDEAETTARSRVTRRSSGRPRYFHKNLLALHSALEDPTRICRRRNYFVRKENDTNAELDDWDEDEEEAEIRNLSEVSAEEDDEENAEPLESDTNKQVIQVHYIVRPLPIRDLSLFSLNEGGSPIRRGISKGSSTADPDDDEIEDCFYRPAACIMPFSMFNPDCRDDIRWNVAALQALDVATTWGIPSKEEDFAEIEEVGVWADVIEDMGVPERPDQTISSAAGDPLLNNPVRPARKRRRIVSQSSPPSKPVALHEAALDGPAEDFVHKSRRVNLQPETRRRVWGLVRKYGNLDRLFSVIRKSPKWRWAGDDPHVFPDLRTDERLLERFRLGADRVQVGDLVRLATVGGLTSRRIQPPQPSKPGNKSSRAEKVVSSTVPALIMSRQELLKLTSGKDSGEVFNHSTLQIRDSQTNGTTAPNNATHLARSNAGAFQTPDNSDISATSDTTAAGPAAASAATPNSAPYALDIPHIDPADYLEVTHIILRRPRLPVSEPPLEAPRKYALNESNPYRPTVRLVGRVYKRVPAARDDWMRARTRT
ncbi:hypothetical protein HK405_005708, partial [Cladochytrium tenue]